MKRFTVILIALVLVIAACDAAGDVTTSDGATVTTEATATTQAPASTEATVTTEAPASTTAPDTSVAPDEEATDTPWWLLILVGVALIFLIAALTRRGSRSTMAAPPPVTWKTQARRGYAEARWLYDVMAEDIAVWRGNATFEGTTAVGATAGTSRAETWEELQRRQGHALDALYALEASPPDNRSAESARRTISALRRTRDMVDARAEARYAYRTAEAGGADSQQLIDARDREVRASRNLAEARHEFAGALTELSTLV